MAGARQDGIRGGKVTHGSGRKDDASHHEGVIALQTSSHDLSGTTASGPAVRGRARLTACALAAIALLATTPAPAMPIGTPTQDPGLVALAAAAVRAGVVRGPRRCVAAGRAVGTTRPVRSPRPGVRPLPPPGPWVRPPAYWWHPGMAVAAGAAIGFVSAAAAASWAGPPPTSGYCWYYTDADRSKGFWDACRNDPARWPGAAGRSSRAM